MLLYISLALTGYLLSFNLSVVAIHIFSKQGILDVPNVRSNHKSATLTGGGVAVVSTIFIMMAISYTSADDAFYIYFLTSLLVLSAISFLDDLRNIPILARIPFQIFAISLLIIGSLSGLDYKILIFLCFVLFGFLNCYNFMDGIDGSATAEAIHISTGTFLIGVMTQRMPVESMVVSLIVISACSGFIKFNWHPARIFLGDVGSTVLGLICGWMLLILASQGFYAAAVILPMYYIADSGLTLFKRLMARKKIWEAHSEHYYQLAARNGMPHNEITKKIMYCNFILLLLSIASLYIPAASITMASIPTFYLLRKFQCVGQ